MVQRHPFQTYEPRTGPEFSSWRNRAAFAQVVADPASDALPIGVDNSSSVHWSKRPTVVDAARDDLCFAVVVADHLLAVDIDVDDDRHTGKAAQTLELLVDAAWASQLPHVVVDSGTGWHLYLVVGTVDDTLRQELVDLTRCFADVRTGHARIRPPGTRHRERRDEVGEWVRARPINQSPQSAWAVLNQRPLDPQPARRFADALRDSLPVTTVAPVPTVTVQRSRLPRSAEQRVAAGMPRKKFRSEPYFHVLCSAIRAGWDEDQWVTFATGTWLARYAKHKKPRSAVDRLRYDYRRSVVRAWNQRSGGEEPRGDVALEAHRLRNALTTTPGVDARWWRQGGHQLVDALLAVVSFSGSTTVHMSVRQAAEAIGLSKSAAHRHLVACEQAGLIGRADPEDPREATLVTVHLEAVAALCSAQPIGADVECPTSEVMQLLSARGADAFAWKGLGAGAWRVWVAHAHSPGTVTPDHLGLSAASYRRTVRRLRHHRLLDRHGYPDPTRLEAAAEELGTAGAGAIRRARHLEDRELFAPIGLCWNQQAAQLRLAVA